jgi:NAD(P)H-dependent FMN reductase
MSGALKNAIDFLYKEWNNKAAGFVGYGSVMGARSVEQLRLVMSEMQVATLRNQVGLSIFTDFVQGEFKPDPRHVQEVDGMLQQLIAWGGALQKLRLNLSQEKSKPLKSEEKNHDSRSTARRSRTRSESRLRG